jgi:hypothetical protein
VGVAPRELLEKFEAEARRPERRSRRHARRCEEPDPLNGEDARAGVRSGSRNGGFILHARRPAAFRFAARPVTVTSVERFK